MGFMAIAFLGFGFSPDIAQKFGMDPVQVMILFRLIQGVGNAFGNGCSLTIVTDMLPRKQFTTGMSYTVINKNGIATWTKPYLSVRRPTIGLDNNKVADSGLKYLRLCC